MTHYEKGSDHPSEKTGSSIHSCIELHCGSNNTCAYVQPEETDFRPGSKLQVYAEVSRRLPEGGLTSYICPSMVSLSFAGFGCQEGALLSFGLVHLVVIFFTLFLAILVELFLRRHVDVFLEVALDISSSNELAPLPSTTESGHRWRSQAPPFDDRLRYA
ncbi:unnamed protein product [Cladocopium goreaui]|uniref:Uncharacterized protein n=1 Tax=Cladocopium goreaui TaxID=2562237 RepID=A0A9P1GNA0_9DINO|nr:unnamed protein product [Cladocopium goreaui]